MTTGKKLPMTAAVLGTGFMGKQYIEILSSLVDDLIVCSADEAGRKLANAHGLRFYSDYNALFAAEQPTFAAICLPTPLHRDAAITALRRGVHVLCEKPFASSAAQAREMLEAAEANGRILMIGHILRFDSRYDYLKSCISDGRYGRLISLDLFRHHPKPDWSVGSWLDDERLSGGMIRDLHIHDTDMVNRLLGMPDAVYTAGNPASCATVYKYPTPVTVTASASWRCANFAPVHGYDAVFENAVIHCENESLALSGTSDCPDVSPIDPLASELIYFCKCVADSAPPLKCMPRDSLNSLILNDAEITSMRLGRETAIRQRSTPWR